MTALFRRARTKLIELRDRLVQPVAVAGEIRIWSPSSGNPSAMNALYDTGLDYILTGTFATLPRGYMNGYNVGKNTGAIINMAAGTCRSDDDTFDLVLTAQIQINRGTAGANGLDVGAIAMATWYSVWVIGDSTAVNATAGLFSLSATAPTLPAGYDKKRRVGWVRTSAASTNWLDFNQRRIGTRTRRYFWDFDIPLLVNAGVATAFTNVDCSTQMPVTARSVIVMTRFLFGTAGAAADVLTLRPAGATSADGPFQTRRGALTGNQSMIYQFQMPTSLAQAIEYKVTQGGANQNTATIRVMAFDDEI